jgi:hypothetical protein
MRLLNLISIPLLVALSACGGKSGGAAPAGPAPVAVTHPNVVGIYDLEMSSARSTQALKQTLQILAGEKPDTYAATLSTGRGTLQYPSGRWQGQDLILSGTDERGNTLQLHLRFEGEKFTGSWSVQGNNRVTGMVKGQKR